MGVLRQNIVPHRKGTSQYSRLSEKLMPGYFSVDERSLGDFLAFTATYAKHFDFFQARPAENGHQKTWGEFFTKDITVVLADIVTVDIDRIDAAFEHLVDRVRSAYQAEDKQIAFEELYVFLVEHAGKVPKWLDLVIKMHALPGTLESEVETEIWKVLDQQMREALILLNHALLFAQEVGLLTHYQSAPFPDYAQEPDEDADSMFLGENMMQQVDHALIHLRSIYHIVINGLAYSVSHFKRYFDRSLEDKSNHHPDVALFITFLKLYDFARQELNGLTLRHLEYYYKHILNQEYRPAIGDSLHACFELVRIANTCRLPAGTLLFAGRDDDGQEIHYATVEEAELNKATVGALKSVFISRVLEGQTWTYKLVTGLYGAPVSNSRDGHGAPFEVNQKDWPLFGEEQYKAGRQTMRPSEIGFAISSPMFMLAEGNRKISIHLTFTEDAQTEGTYRKLLEDLSRGDDEESLRYALLDVFGRGRDCAFNILLSGEEGWVNIADESSNTLYVESKPWSWNRITISFTIPNSCPPIVPIDPSIMDPEGFGTKFPVAKFILNPRKTPFGYTFLETLRFEQIDIDVEVDKIKNVTMFNEIGRLDSSQPFQAFGAIPTPGSYMLVGNAELFRKKLETLKFYIEWQNLPQRGLGAYYKEYFDGDSELDENKFRINLSALSGYEFKPGDKDEPIVHRLFPREVGTAQTVMEVEDPGRLQIRPNPDIREVGYFDNSTAIGFFKMELAEPPEAFGHQLFQDRMALVAQRNADPEESEVLKFPNPPFSPMVKSITMSYRASDRIVPEQYDPTSRNEIYHLHPFGSAPVYSRGQLKMKAAAIVPEYREDGYLYIGLKDLYPPQEVSLLFQLAAGKTTFTAALPETKWAYLTSTDWEPLRNIDVLSDTTDAFTRTGIVRLRLPTSMSDRNGVLPKGMHWLRVSITGDTENVSRALEIRTQAIRAEWVDNGNSERLREPMAAGSVNGLVTKRPEIRGVSQPYPSFHARAAESQNEFFQRVSERLRHKGRAITHWDYERLILDEFHTVAQVKCLSHISEPDYVHPGELRIVVIPGNNQATDQLTPKVNHGTLLSIQNYLQQCASPFVDMRVSNPAYEYVRVNCRVKFANGRNDGDSLAKLRADIQDFICPWLKAAEREIEIGGSLKVEDLYRFIKSLSYVQFITKFAVLHFFVEDEETGIYQLLSTADPRLSEDERSYIRARKPWSVLIPDMDHEIEFTEREIEVAPDFSLEPVDFQGRFQISPHLIKILPKPELPEDNPYIRYEQEDTLRIFVDIPD